MRRVMETPLGYDPGLWEWLATMGVAGLVIDEAHGGSGAGTVALERVMEAAGAALLCSPMLGSSVLAAGFLQALGDEAASARLLPGMAEGRIVAALAMTGATGCWTEAGVAVAATGGDDGWHLSGEASFVLNGASADVLIVLANAPEGLAAFEVDPHAANVMIEALPTFDHTLRLARLGFEAAPATRLRGKVPVWTAAEQALALALVALAGDQAGGARRCFDFTLDYARTRVQFGRPIGGFQAIKHMAADLLIEAEQATSAARAAAKALEDGALEEGAPDAKVAISLAAFACAEAYATITATSIQMHGGVAFTWAHPAHLYLRRARSGAQLFGAPAFHRERYLQALGG